jgi:hypothetical protein
MEKSREPEWFGPSSNGSKTVPRQMEAVCAATALPFENKVSGRGQLTDRAPAV